MSTPTWKLKSYAGTASLMIGLILIYAGYWFFAYYNTWTDDVYVSAPVLNMVPFMDGVVDKIYVQDNQSVKKGDKLLDLAPLPPHSPVPPQTLFAPVDGFVSNLNLYRGQAVMKGQSLFGVINRQEWWIVARYRETVLRRIHPGAPVRIKLDMYPGKVFKGHVQSIGYGINRVETGAVVSSPLVYMKPTEYWIKIAQRFPVKIVFDELPAGYPLRVGASGTTWIR